MEMSKEVWRPVPFAPEYEVSSFGRVKNEFGRILKGNIKHGYHYVNIRSLRDYRVHRLVALVFIPNPNNLPIVNHLDHNRLNNKVDNLEWCTQKDNVLYSAHLTSATMKGIKKSAETKRKISLTKQKQFENRELPSYIYRYRNGFKFQVVREGKYIGLKSFETLSEAVKYREKWLRRKGYANN